MDQGEREKESSDVNAVRESSNNTKEREDHARLREDKGKATNPKNLKPIFVVCVYGKSSFKI